MLVITLAQRKCSCSRRVRSGLPMLSVTVSRSIHPTIRTTIRPGRRRSTRFAPHLLARFITTRQIHCPARGSTACLKPPLLVMSSRRPAITRWFLSPMAAVPRRYIIAEPITTVRWEWQPAASPVSTDFDCPNLPVGLTGNLQVVVNGIPSNAQPVTISSAPPSPGCFFVGPIEICL